jgi:hypothetical protein
LCLVFLPAQHCSDISIHPFICVHVSVLWSCLLRTGSNHPDISEHHDTTTSERTNGNALSVQRIPPVWKMRADSGAGAAPPAHWDTLAATVLANAMVEAMNGLTISGRGGVRELTAIIER